MAIPPHKCDEKPWIKDGKIINKKISSFEKYESNTYDYSSWNYILLGMTAPFNWSGNPAATLPCGFSKLGLPVGLQIAAPNLKNVNYYKYVNYLKIITRGTKKDLIYNII